MSVFRKWVLNVNPGKGCGKWQVKVKAGVVLIFLKIMNNFVLSKLGMNIKLIKIFYMQKKETKLKKTSL